MLSGFCSSCLQTPLLCPLAKNYTSAADLEDAIYKELDSLKDNPINASGTNFTYDYFKGDVLQSVLIETKYWTVLAYILNSLFTKDIPSLAKLSHMVTSSSSNPLTTNQQLSQLGIQCSDKTVRASELNQVTPYMSTSRSLSKIFGDMNDGSIATCAQWKMPAKEQYNGSFHIKTPTPFLLIGNSFDPLTPLSSAHNVSAGLEGSVVLQQNGYGVSTNSHPIPSDISPVCVCVGTTWLIYFVFVTIAHIVWTAFVVHGEVCPGVFCKRQPPFQRDRLSTRCVSLLRLGMSKIKILRLADSIAMLMSGSWIISLLLRSESNEHIDTFMIICNITSIGY